MVWYNCNLVIKCTLVLFHDFRHSFLAGGMSVIRTYILIIWYISQFVFVGFIYLLYCILVNLIFAGLLTIFLRYLSYINVIFKSTLYIKYFHKLFYGLILNIHFTSNIKSEYFTTTFLLIYYLTITLNYPFQKKQINNLLTYLTYVQNLHYLLFKSIILNKLSIPLLIL